MKIVLNGETKEVSEGITVGDFLSKINSSNKFIAVAVNREFVPKNNYESIYLKSMDEIEVVSPHPGG